MFPNRQQCAPRLERSGLEVPDIGFRFGFGAYVAAILTATVTAAAGLAGVTGTTVLALAPGTVTVGVIGGGILAGQYHGLAERLGRRRWLGVQCSLPALPFVGLALTPFVTNVGASVAGVAILGVIGIVLAGLLVAAMATNRYVDAVTSDEPAVAWTWAKAGVLRRELVIGVGFLLVGLGSFYSGDRTFTVLWGGHGLFWLVAGYSSSLFDADSVSTPTLAAHEAGLVVDRGFTKRLLPWEAITGVEITADELVIERDWRSLRCRRDAIDDSESVAATLEGLRTER
ncbi:PH domain-containing protein [Natronosalvus halobius]|uniref:PH domain-containing protein n=1 Tax=Natronosalvus halobius TaxID=2953746 RepID=UPI00209EF01E|nr:PH domain-containing protein [Natronosalvus halobius]USZ71076.1 PH domain-containing protein [Natronosalvus halobius]